MKMFCEGNLKLTYIQSQESINLVFSGCWERQSGTCEEDKGINIQYEQKEFILHLLLMKSSWYEAKMRQLKKPSFIDIAVNQNTWEKTINFKLNRCHRALILCAICIWKLWKNRMENGILQNVLMSGMRCDE